MRIMKNERGSAQGIILHTYEVCALCREDGVVGGTGRRLAEVKMPGRRSLVPERWPLPRLPPLATSMRHFSSCALSSFRDSPSCFLFLKFSLILSSNSHKRTGCFLCAIRISF